MIKDSDLKRLSNDLHRAGEAGSALVYILIAIALLALLTVTFMEPSSQQTQSQNTFKLVSNLETQADFIRSSVQECVLAYPRGDKGDDATGAPRPNKADIVNHRYPIMPDADYLDNCGANPSETAGTIDVQYLRCPGNPGDDPCHQAMFGGMSGKFLPPAPDLFGDWQWYNGTDGVFFWIETDKSDAYIQTALTKLEENFSACEADTIDATGGAVNLDSGATVQCSGGSTCFRVWIRMDSGSAVFPDEAGCP